jgi:hypothetical protein
MQSIQVASLSTYLLITAYFSLNWLNFRQRKASSSPEETFLSFVIFLIATLFWPIAVPMYCMELWKTKKLEFSTVIPVILGVGVFSLSLLYLN